MAQGFLVQTAPAAAAPAATSVGDSAIETIVGGVEVGGAGVAMAYLNARSPAEGKTYHELFGYTTDVVLGLGGLGLGLVLALFGSRAYGHFMRVGFGCLIEAGIRVGFEKGVQDRDDEKKQLTAKKAKLQLVESKQSAVQSTGIAKNSSQDVFQPVG